MPRTKITKSSKRNREEQCTQEKKLREFHEQLERSLYAMESGCLEDISLMESEVAVLVERSHSALLKMKMVDFFKLNLDKLSAWESELPFLPQTSFYSNNNKSCSSTSGSVTSLRSSNLASGSILRSGKQTNDEGYITEDSRASGENAAHIPLASIENKSLATHQCGPLSSARARRFRRSRSACDNDRLLNALKPMQKADNNNYRSSRSKLRTPMATPRHAVSVDRIADRNIQKSPPTAFMRWPEPGELVVSTRGSPIVSQVMPPRIANVNIPMRNGILSLQPKKLDELQKDFIEAIDNETLHQIRTLNANLDLIVAMADKAKALK